MVRVCRRAFFFLSNLGVLLFCLKSALLKYRAGRHYMLTCVTTYMHAVAAALLPICQ